MHHCPAPSRASLFRGISFRSGMFPPAVLGGGHGSPAFVSDVRLKPDGESERLATGYCTSKYGWSQADAAHGWPSPGNSWKDKAAHAVRRRRTATLFMQTA
jgi:hypothetical protein